MEKRNRRKFSAEFKIFVVLEALKKLNTMEEIARKYEVYSYRIYLWKKEFLNKASSVYTSGESHSEEMMRQGAVVEKL